MAHARGRFRGRSDTNRRKKIWAPLTSFARGEDGAGDSTAVSATINLQFSAGVIQPAGEADSNSLGIVFQAGAQIPNEATILRIRGSLLMDKNVSSPATTTTFGFGMGVMETGAALAGAFPNPATPDGSLWDGWMFYRSINSAIVDAASTVLDVKAMRKVQSGYSLVLAYGVESAPVDATDQVITSAGQALITVRALFLLP